MLFRRSFSAVSVLLATLFAGAASAQTTLKLVYTQAGGGPQTCVYTTDGNNVSLETATGALTTTGGTFGANCPTAVAPTAPSFSNTLTSDLQASYTTGATVTLNWQADADSCIYDGTVLPTGVTFASWPATGSACSAGTCNTPHSVNLQLATNGTYKFKVTCSRTGVTQTVSSEANTVVSTQSTGCVAPAGVTRLTNTEVCGNGAYAYECRTIDVTKFENIFGFDRARPTQLTVWPGLRNLVQRPQINNNQYLSLQFTVPANFGTKAGHYQLSEDNVGGNQGLMSMTISKDCGNFSTTNPMGTKCLLNLGGEQTSMTWAANLPASDPDYNNVCRLNSGETYFLNIVYGSLATPGTNTCAGAQYCNRPVMNQSAIGW